MRAQPIADARYAFRKFMHDVTLVKMGGPSEITIKGLSPMKKRVASLALLASAVAMTSAASAAPNWSGPGIPHAMFVQPPAQPAIDRTRGSQPAASLAQWNGGFTDLTGHSISYTMVGADPAVSNSTTHVKVYLIPVTFIYGPDNGNKTFNPKKAKLNGNKNIIKSLLSSPIFDDGADFKSGSIDCGTGQFTDTFQRCNFWSHVSTNTSYHTVIDYTKAKALKPLKITVTAAQGSVINNPFGSGVVGTYPINSFETQAHSYMSSHSADITPDTFPFFISYDIYLTSGGCCIGGYHNRSGSHGTGQTYGYTTIVDSAGAFSMDIDAASHEAAEWLDDPFVDNHVNCNDNSILEVGDPVEGKANYGTFPVTLNGYTWHPQDEAQLPYFGAPTSTSANGWTDTNHFLNGAICPGQ